MKIATNKKDVEGLIENLKYRTEWSGRKAAEALVEIGEPAVEHLTKTLKDEN